MVKKNFKSIKKIVFNQDKSNFALIWQNLEKEIEVEESKSFDLDDIPLRQSIITQNGEVPKFELPDDEELNEGFTLYDAKSLNEILIFDKKDMLNNHNI